MLLVLRGAPSFFVGFWPDAANAEVPAV